MTNLNGFHIVDYEFDDAHVAVNMDLLRVTRPAWITVHGAAQYKEALNFSKLVRRDLPETQVIFRHCINKRRPGKDEPAIDSQDDDTGRHARMTAQSWWDNIGSQYIGSDLTVLTDNESGADDLTYYSNWQTKVMDLAALHGVSLAVGRFSTHNPPKAQWKELDTMWRALNIYHNLHIFSPNVYFSPDNLDGIEHIFGAWQRCAELEIKAPRTVIGEYAFLRNIKDANHGYKSVNMDGGALIELGMKVGSPLWAAEIPVCWYAIGEWPLEADTFGLDAAALKVLRERATNAPPPPPIVMPPTYPTLPPLSDEKAWIPAYGSSPGVNVRKQPVVIDKPDSNVIETFSGQNMIGRRTAPIAGFPDWCGWAYDSVKGYVHRGHIAFADRPATPAPPEIVPPPDTITRAELNAALDRLRAEFDAKLARLFTPEVLAAMETQGAVRVAKAG